MLAVTFCSAIPYLNDKEAGPDFQTGLGFGPRVVVGLSVGLVGVPDSPNQSFDELHIVMNFDR